MTRNSSVSRPTITKLGPTNTYVPRAVLVDPEHLSCPESHPFQRLFSLHNPNARVYCLVIVSTCAWSRLGRDLYVFSINVSIHH
jgi:hypothetical protein